MSFTRPAFIAFTGICVTLALQGPVQAQLKREYTSGLNRICVYETLSGEKSSTISGVAICPMSHRDSDDPRYSKQIERPSFGRLKSESSEGMTKTCVYETLRGNYTLDIRRVSLCPLSLR